MKYLLIVEGDMNDADYKSEVVTVDKDDLELVRKVAKAISETNHHYNWPCYDGGDDRRLIYKGILTPDEIEGFDEIVYLGGDYGIHSINSITLLHTTKSEELI